jgi:membrane-associated phospholipid phosphatase
MRGRPVGLVLWLVLLAGVQAAAFAVVWRFFVRSEHGQLLDTVALAGSSIGRARMDDVVTTVLNTISALSLAIATAVVGFIALIRRRIAVAFGAMFLIVGANVTTQVLKHVISRPEVGVDLERAAAGNSMPSGHTTIAASVAVALLLVLPARLRGFGAVAGAVLTAVAGVATLSAGWHRPSDAVAALLVVGVWACVTGLFVVMWRRDGDLDRAPPDRFVVLALGACGLALLAGAGLAMALTNQVLSTPPAELSRYRLLAAYAGGAAGIAGAAGLVLASVLVTVHRLVPQVRWPSARDETEAMGREALNVGDSRRD